MLSLLPLQYLLPSFLIQKVVNLHHRLDMFLRRLPSLAYKGIVELLR